MTPLPALLDIEAILAPIPGDSSAGHEIRYSPLYDDIRGRRRAIEDKTLSQLAISRSSLEFESMFDSGPSREEMLKAICHDALAALTHESKDLQLAAWLLEASSALHGLRGAISGLELIREMLDRYWGTLFPLPDPEDDEPLARRAMVLETMSRNLTTWLRAMPLNEHASVESWSLADYRSALNRERSRADREVIHDIRNPDIFRYFMRRSSQAHLNRLSESLALCREQVCSLEAVTDSRCVMQWPGRDGQARWVPMVSFRSLTDGLDECARVVNDALSSMPSNWDEPSAGPDEPEVQAVHHIRDRDRPDDPRRQTPHAMDIAFAEFRMGRLDVALDELTRALASSPNHRAMNVMLFVLLCFKADFDGAGRQLDLLGADFEAHRDSTDVQRGLDVVAGLVAESRAYRDLFVAEGRRAEVFRGSGRPQFLAPPPPYVEAHLQLVKTLQTDKIRAAMALESAEDATPAVTGRLVRAVDPLANQHLWSFGLDNVGQAFSHIRDADDRLGGILEVFGGAEYFWVPFSQIVELTVAARAPLLDELWLRARLTVVNHQAVDVLLPALYIDSALWLNTKFRNSWTFASTDWTVIDNRMVVGAGHRVFLVDGEEVQADDIGRITITQ